MHRLRYLKILAITVAVLISVLAIGLAVLLYYVDPKVYASEINRYLAPYDLRADFNGKIAWQVYPRIAISIDDMDVIALPASKSLPEATLVEFERFSAVVALMPLFQKKIEVMGVELKGLKSDFIIDKNGRSPWLSVLEKLSQNSGKSKPSAADLSKQETIDLVDFQIDTLSINDLAMSYHDQRDNSRYQISKLNLLSNDFRLDGKAFTLHLDSRFSVEPLADAKVSIDAEVAIDLAMKTLSLLSAVLALDPASSPKQSIDLNLDGKLTWVEPLSAQFNIEQKSLNPKTLLSQLKIDAPATRNEQALTRFSSMAEIALVGDKLKVVLKQLQLDKTAGSADLQLISKDNSLPEVTVKLVLDKLNLDDYLAPKQAEASASTANTQTNPLPIDDIKQNKLSAGLSMGQLSLAGQTLDKVTIGVSVKSGIAALDTFSANFGQGSIKGNAKLNTKPRPAVLAGQFVTKNIDIGKLLVEMADLDNLAGSADSQVNFSSKGNTDIDLMENLIVDAGMQSRQFSVTPINLEQRFCEAMAILQKQELSGISWAKLTPIEEIETKLRYQNNIVEITTLDAKVQKLAAKAHGKLDIGSGNFSFPFELNLSKFAEPTELCGGIQEQWRKWNIPLICKGNYNKIDYKTCLPDFGHIEDLIKGYAQSEIDKKKNIAKAKLQAELDEKKEKLKKQAREEEEKIKAKLEAKAKEKKDKLREKLNDFLSK